MIGLVVYYPSFMVGNNNNTLFHRLKRGFNVYKENAQRLRLDLGKDRKDKKAILTWHYRQYLRVDEDCGNDMKKHTCHYCDNKCNNCKCHYHLKAWFEAACLVGLIMPSSAAAERIFSLLPTKFIQ